MYDNKPYLKVDLSNNYPTTNLCNNSNDSPNAWKSCYNSSYSYLLRASRITITENGSSKDYVIFTNSSAGTSPATLNSSYVSNFNSSVGGISLELPDGVSNPYVLFPITDYYNVGYASLSGDDYNKGYYFDTDSPEYRSYNDWSSLSKTFKKGTLIPYRSSLLSSSDTPSGDTSSDYSQISNAIYYLGATILVVCFFSVIYKMFIRLRG